MGHLEKGPQTSQIFSATLPPPVLPLRGGRLLTIWLSGCLGRGESAVLLGMRLALRLGQSPGQDSYERLEQLPMASPVAFLRVMGMKVPVGDVIESSTFWGASGTLYDITGRSSPDVLPRMIGETGTSYDVSVSLL